MSTGQYLLGGAAGLVFGLLVAAGNTLLTRRSLLRARQSTTSVMGTSGLRQVINLAALVLVYLLRGVVPLPLYSLTARAAIVGRQHRRRMDPRAQDGRYHPRRVRGDHRHAGAAGRRTGTHAGGYPGGRTEGRHKWVKQTYCFPSDRWRSPARS